MSDGPVVPNNSVEAASQHDEVMSAEYVASKELEKLPPEMKTMVSVMTAVIRSTTGPDPETSRIVAQAEMHEESCKLEGYRETLKTRDRQGERDHEFRKKKLNHDTARSMLIAMVCIAGIIAGLYLIVARNNSSVGTPLLVASFMALIGGKSLFPKEKD